MHGDFFYFIRDKAFLARDPIANASGQPKPDERRQQFGGSLGGSGSVSYLFKHQGEIVLSKKSNSATTDEVLEKSLEAGAEDMVEDELAFIVYTRTDDLHQVKEKLEKQNLNVESAQLVFAPAAETQVKVDLPEKEQKVIKLLESLEELDDVQNVYSNLG